jgi:hypothetical protein
MHAAEAKAMVALLQGYFPVPQLPPSTVTLWAEALGEFDRADVETAIRKRGRFGRAVRELAHLIEDVVYERQLRYERDRPALPADGSWSEDQQRQAAAQGAELIRQWRESKSAPVPDDPETALGSLVEAVVKPVADAPSPAELERRRTEGRQRLEAAYGDEIARQEAEQDKARAQAEEAAQRRDARATSEPSGL